MKKITFKILNVLMLMPLLLVSCHCTDSADIDYSLKCSSDLLDYVTAHVTYVSDGGNVVKYDIHDEEWKESENGQSSSSTVIINGDTIKKDGKTKEWKKHVNYDKSSVNDEMTVTFTLKKNVPEDAFVYFANFYVDLSANLVIEDDGEKLTSKSETSQKNDPFSRRYLKDYVEGIIKHIKIEANVKQSSIKSDVHVNI